MVFLKAVQQWFCEPGHLNLLGAWMIGVPFLAAVGYMLYLFIVDMPALVVIAAYMTIGVVLLLWRR
jgi:hypothetical protein